MSTEGGIIVNSGIVSHTSCFSLDSASGLHLHELKIRMGKTIHVVFFKYPEASCRKGEGRASLSGSILSSNRSLLLFNCIVTLYVRTWHNSCDLQNVVWPLHTINSNRNFSFFIFCQYFILSSEVFICLSVCFLFPSPLSVWESPFYYLYIGSWEKVGFLLELEGKHCSAP